MTQTVFHKHVLHTLKLEGWIESDIFTSRAIHGDTGFGHLAVCQVVISVNPSVIVHEGR
jgi:hypothetical protein